LAHGKLIGLDVAEAAAMPGVIGIFTAADLDLKPMWTSGALPAAFSRPILAGDIVRFVGEPLAVVVAETRAQAMDAAELVMAEVDQLPAVVDPAAAAAADAPLLFPEAGTNVAMEFDTGDDPAFFEGADVVIEQRVVAQILAPVPLEVNACTAEPGEDTLTVWASIQD